MDSVPLIAITGQVPQAMIGKGAFQETDFFGMTLPVVKHSYLITDVNEIARVVKEAFYIARTGRPGPVVIDFPKNIQQARTQPIWPAIVVLPGYDPEKKADDLALNEIIGLIEKAERPVLYCGGGIITANASRELLQFAEATQNSRHHHDHGMRRVSGDARAFVALAGHARRRLRQLGRQRRVSTAQESR